MKTALLIAPILMGSSFALFQLPETLLLTRTSAGKRYRHRFTPKFLREQLVLLIATANSVGTSPSLVKKPFPSKSSAVSEVGVVVSGSGTFDSSRGVEQRGGSGVGRGGASMSLASEQKGGSGLDRGGASMSLAS